jgi:hypothetical protein
MVARRIVVSTQERVSGEKHAFAVRTPAFQNGSGFQGKPHVRFALEWCTPITGFKGVEPDPLSIMLCSPSIRQSNSYKSWDPANNDSILALLQSWRGGNVFGETADSSYVQSNTCAGIGDGSRLVRGDMSFYLLQGPTKLRTSVLPWTPTFVNDYTFSVVFWVEEPERSIYPPFFHVWMNVRGPNERVPVDFSSFRMDRNDGTRWQVAVSHCSLIHLYGSQAYGLAITSRTFVDDPYQGLSVLGFLPGSRVQDALSYVGQMLTLKGINDDTGGGSDKATAR